MDTSSTVYLNGNQSAPRYERGRPDTHWQSNGVPSSSKNQMIANNARYRDDFRNHFHVNSKSTDPQQSGPSSFASEKINRKVYIKPEPEDTDLEMDRRLNVKQEPEERMLPYDEPSQTNYLHAPFARSAAPSPSTASAFSQDLATNAVSNAVDAAITNVQEDQMDSALIDSAIQSVRSIDDQANGDTTSAQSSNQSSINDTAEKASASSVPNETNFVLGTRPIKVEDVDANVYEAVRQRMRQGKSTSQPAQVQDNQREPETEVPIQDPLRQAATYSTVLSTTAQPLTTTELSTTSGQETLERAVLLPYQVEQSAEQSQTASSSALSQTANSLLQVSSSDGQQSPSSNSDVQSPSEAVPSTLILTPPTQNVNPRLIAPMPRRALRSCLVSAIQKQREKRNVTFNTQAENNLGETWPIILEEKGEQI
ncbi:hypothetical protein L7F22_039144 [Adiantum nelumboides]|nr:hypothetical protein [Adiantum nelumboides]